MALIPRPIRFNCRARISFAPHQLRRRSYDAAWGESIGHTACSFLKQYSEYAPTPHNCPAAGQFAHLYPTGVDPISPVDQRHRIRPASTATLGWGHPTPSTAVRTERGATQSPRCSHANESRLFNCVTTHRLEKSSMSKSGSMSGRKALSGGRMNLVAALVLGAFAMSSQAAA